MRITCLPDGKTVEASSDRSLLDGLIAAGIPIAHACGGHGACSTCRVRVLDGLATCRPRNDVERAMAERLRFEDAIRLACQTRFAGDASVRRLVLDPEDVALTSQIEPHPFAGASGRELPVAILFADVNGFTPLSEALPPYDVIHLLNRWFHQAGRRIALRGGFVDNFMGDGLIALFGADGAPAAAARAVRAGLDLLDEAETVSAYLRSAYDRAFGVRIGIHYGPAVVGALGACGRARETAIGDAVNFASRIQDANKAGGTRLLVSEAVWREVKDRAAAGRRMETAIRGKTGTHALYEIVGMAKDE